MEYQFDAIFSKSNLKAVKLTLALTKFFQFDMTLKNSGM
jgi:hypothetical protein